MAAIDGTTIIGESILISGSLNGDEDLVFPPFAGAALAALAPKGKAVMVQRAGHSVYFERAAEFNRIVGEFLSTS